MVSSRHVLTAAHCLAAAATPATDVKVVLGQLSVSRTNRLRKNRRNRWDQIFIFVQFIAESVKCKLNL